MSATDSDTSSSDSDIEDFDDWFARITGLPAIKPKPPITIDEQIIEDIRLFYQTNLTVLSPLPMVHIRPLDDDFFTELVIKQISNIGSFEIKARNEFSFREIFKDRGENSHLKYRILVEGQAGYGKTTLARNICLLGFLSRNQI